MNAPVARSVAAPIQSTSPPPLLLRALWGGVAKSAQALDAGFRHVVLRQARDKSRLVAEQGQRDGDVGFASAKGHFQDGSLIQAEMARRGQAHHDFPKGDCFHGDSIFFLNELRWKTASMNRAGRVVESVLRAQTETRPLSTGIYIARRLGHGDGLSRRRPL